MHKVISLERRRNKDTSELIAYLADQDLAGRLDGMVLQTIDADGKEHTFFTGAYRNNPDRAVGAGLRMSMKLTMVQGGLADL